MGLSLQLTPGEGIRIHITGVLLVVGPPSVFRLPSAQQAYRVCKPPEDDRRSILSIPFVPG